MKPMSATSAVLIENDPLTFKGLRLVILMIYHKRAPEEMPEGPSSVQGSSKTGLNL